MVDLELVSTRTFVVTHFIRTFVLVVINCLDQKGCLRDQQDALRREHSILQEETRRCGGKAVLNLLLALLLQFYANTNERDMVVQGEQDRKFGRAQVDVCLQ